MEIRRKGEGSKETKGRRERGRKVRRWKGKSEGEKERGKPKHLF